MTAHGRAAVLVVLTVTLGGQVGAARVGDLDIEPDPAVVAVRVHGYLDTRFVVTNRSAVAPHTVTLSLPARSYSRGWGQAIGELSRTFVVPPAATVVVTLPCPALPIFGDGIEVAVDGRRQAEPLPYSFTNHFMRDPDPIFNVRLLVSRSVPDQELKKGARIFDPKRMNQLVRPDGGVLDWPEAWLSYSSYDGIVVTAGDMRRMPPVVRDAVTRAVEAGGTLTVLGPFDPPAEWGPGHDTGHGGVRGWQPGFGQAFSTPSDDVARVADEAWTEIRGGWLRSLGSWPEKKTVGAANTALPVVDQVGVPIRGFFILMLLFSCAIGPVNLILLSRAKRRIWMLVTVPAISLVTALAVCGYALVREGTDRWTRVRVVTVLDEEAHRAASVGWIAFYSPLTPSGGLHFSADTELTLEATAGGGGESPSIDWTDGQHLDSGWLAARVPAHFRVRKVESRRERLPVSFGARGPEVVNGLGARITRLSWQAPDGAVYTAGAPIEAGARAVLARRTEPLRGAIGALRTGYAGDWLSLAEMVTTRPDVALAPGGYVAVLDGSPFLEPGLAARSRGLETTVIGRAAAPSPPAIVEGTR